MKYYLQLGFVLLLIAAIASGILAMINDFTAPIIAQKKLETEVNARMEVLPDAKIFVADSIQTVQAAAAPDPLKITKESTGASYFHYYKGLSADSTLVGYCFIASLYGYSSDVKTMVGVNPDLTVNKIKVISQQETPGLGANCEAAEFQARFVGLSETQMKVDKDGGDVKSITGATITTRAITNSIRAGLETLKKQASTPAPAATPVEETEEV